MKRCWSKFVVVLTMLAMLALALGGCGSSKEEKKPEAGAGPKGKSNDLYVYLSGYY